MKLSGLSPQDLSLRKPLFLYINIKKLHRVTRTKYKYYEYETNAQTGVLALLI